MSITYFKLCFIRVEIDLAFSFRQNLHTVSLIDALTVVIRSRQSDGRIHRSMGLSIKKAGGIIPDKDKTESMARFECTIGTRTKA
jgi:hypothetical protein